MAEKDSKDLVPASKTDSPDVQDGSIVSEVVEAIRGERIGQININILLQRVTERHEDPDAMIVRTEKMLALAEKYEQGRLRAFSDRANAIIDVRLRDPDEIDKRHNNKARRCLKYSVGALAGVGLVGSLVSVWLGAGVVLAGPFGCSGALGLAMLGPMATGESISPTDIVRIVTAIRGIGSSEEQSKDDQSQKKKNRR